MSTEDIYRDEEHCHQNPLIERSSNSMIENDRNSDIEIIQPNDDSFDVNFTSQNEVISSKAEEQAMSNDENETEKMPEDSIKVSKEDLMRMMTEINQLKQMQVNKQQHSAALEIMKEKEVRLGYETFLRFFTKKEVLFGLG